ncbi:MAG: phosphate ABC transporter substrate-binding/OmpA family protein [Acidobacteriota bacterium]
MWKKLVLTIGIVLGAAATVATGESVRIKGSDTIGGKLAPELARAFRAARPEVEFEIDALGSSTAFIGLFDGSAQIGAASRPVNEKELNRARELGLRLNEAVIGYDGVAVIVHPSNPIASLTVAQLAELFTGSITNWRQLGGVDSTVRLISRPSYSGTHAFFKERVVRRGNAKGSEEFAPATEFVEENGAILAAVAGDPRAVSYVGLGWLGQQVKALSVAAQSGEEAAKPTLANVRAGSYPLYRPLLMYVREDAPSAALDFLRFVLSTEGAALVQAEGFVPPDQTGALPGFLAAPRTPSAGTAVAEVVRIRFAFNSSRPRPEDQARLVEVARKISAGHYRATLTGHADGKGPTEVNRRIALARARVVADELAGLGAPRDAMRIESAGADAPVASNTIPAGRAENRRVDISLVPVP